MTKRSIRITGLCRALLLAGALSLVACEPSPEERVTRAEGYMADANYRAAILELKNAARANPDYAAARLLLGEASYQVGDLLTAESEYARALGLGEDRPEVWVALGRTLLEMGRAEDAFERVVMNLDDVSDVEAVHVLKGDVLSVLGNREKATAAYDVALGLNSQSPGALIGIAVLAAVAQEYERAREFIELAAAADPDSTIVWRTKGNYLATRGEFSRAADAYARSISVETPTTPLLRRFLTRVNMTTTLLDGQRINEAEQQLSELQEKYPPHPILRYLAGRIAFINGDYDAAQRELQKYLAQIPRDARGQALLGAVNFSQDNLRQAEMYLMQAVRANTGGDGTRRLLAETLLRLNRPEEALTELQSSLAIGQQDPILFAMLGRAKMGVGEIEEAIGYFEQGSAADPGDPALNLALAAAYLQGNRADAAIRVLEMMPEAPGRLYTRETLLIGAYLREGLRDKAIDRGNDLLRRSPADPRVFALVGVLNVTIGNTERAEGLFGKALELDPDNLGALFNLGTIAYAKEDFAQSEDYFGRLLDVHPAYIPGLVSMSAALQRKDSLADMRPRLVAAIEAAPQSVEPLVLLARLELAEGRPEEALIQVAAARNLFPDEAGLDHFEGKILLLQDRRIDALESFQRAVWAAPDNATYVFELASAQLNTGDFGGAARSARDYRQLQPQDVRGLSLLVNAEIRAGAPENVMSEVEEFLANNPDIAMAHLLAGDVQLANGFPHEALRYYETGASKEWTRGAAFQIARARSAAGVSDAAEPLARWLSENPDDTDVRFMHAQLLEADGKLEKAVTEYEYLYAAGKLNAVGLNNLAWHYSIQGRREAIDLATEAHELAPENGSITDTLGWILFGNGEPARAVQLLRLAASQTPDNPEIRFHLASALAEVGERNEASRVLDALIQSPADFPSRAEAIQLAERL